MANQRVHFLSLPLLLIFSLLAASNATKVRSPLSPRTPRSPLPPDAARLALAACNAVNLTSFNDRLAQVQEKVNAAMAANTTHSTTTTKKRTLWEGTIPGNLLGLGLWPGCSFSGDEITTTTLKGLNYFQLTELASEALPVCTWDDDTKVAFFDSSVSLALSDTEALQAVVDLKYTGQFCSMPGVDVEYAKLVASISGLNGSATMIVGGYVNATHACINTLTVVDVDLTYSTVTTVASVPPLDLSLDLSSKVASKLNDALPTAAANIEQKINTNAEGILLCNPV